MADQRQPSKVKQGWRTGERKAGARPTGTERRRKLFTLLFVLLALAGATVAWLIIFRPVREPYFLPLCITEYKDRRLPANAQADQDREALLAGNYFPRRATNAYASQEG